MNNELYRKLTSITLATVMFAGGMTVAMPGELPVAVAQTTSGTLSVSATGSFGGPQVIEIIVDDPDQADSGSPPPTVKINEEAVEMRQATTGKWYAYVADDSFTTSNLQNTTITDTDNNVIGYSVVVGFLDGAPKRTPDANWPFVQTYGLDGDVKITADRNEVATLTYEDSSTVTISSDRRDVPAGGQVHITISDFQLNLDPTATDVWTLNTDAVATYDRVTGDVILWNDDVATLEVANPALAGGITSVTIEETGTNTGVFESSTGIKVVDTANPGQSFSITYAGERQQIIVGDFSSTLELAAGGAWDPREDLIVRVTDERLNLDTETDAVITVDSDDIPVVILGEPITLGTTNPTIISMNATDDRPTGTIDVNSAHVGTLIQNGADTNIELTLTLSKDQVSQIMSTSSYIYYMGPAMAAFGHDDDVSTDDATPGLDMALLASTDGVTLTGASVVDNDGDAENGVTITIRYDTLEINAKNPIIFDIFTIGEYENDDGDTVTENNAIYRALLEETGSGVFEGTIKYQMLNQRTVNDPNAHGDITVLDKDLEIILDNGYTGTDGVTVEYGDKVVREDAPSHTGEVSLDSETYRVADTVTITLADADLNTLSLVDIYTISATDDDLLDVGIISGCADQIGSISMRETASDSGVFEGTFDVPASCPRDSDVSKTGEGITVTYFDFRDASGAENEWADSATIGANTGSIALDRTVYPVPGDDAVTIYIAVSDADVDKSSDSAETLSGGLVTMKIDGESFALTDDLEETSPDSGVFEIGIGLDSTDEIEQGDVITVEYRDQSDASGSTSTAFDSATFDLRNAVLTSDKSTYVIGQDAFLTLIEPDLNLDSASQETIDLDLIGWDSKAADTNLDNGAFGAVPANLRESGANTGVFHVSITIPEDIGGTNLERGEEITLTYEDNGPSGADSVGDDQRDVELSIETSNFGATLELDQNIYTWTDKVFITIVASDYNFDSNVIDEIGDEGDGEITVRIRNNDIETYNLAETGPDTGVFTGEVVLIGTTYEAGDNIDLTVSKEQSTGSGPTDGTIEADNGDGLSVSFEYSDSEAPLVASALIRWNVGEVQWLEASYAATGSGIVRVIDPDMNLNPDAVDNLDMVVHSETFLGGITLTVTETQEASGIFEGAVEFDPDEASQGHRLQVTEGDIVTAEYDDYTLPDNDDITVTATTLIGSIVPPLERAPASNPAIVDAFGTAIASVSVDQQVQITADLTSGQDRDQDFAYLVQIQNEDGVTVQLTWLAGTLGGGATFSAAQSWTPSETGSYTATIFVWESVSNPAALSPQLSIAIDVV